MKKIVILFGLLLAVILVIRWGQKYAEKNMPSAPAGESVPGSELQSGGKPSPERPSFIISAEDGGITGKEEGAVDGRKVKDRVRERDAISNEYVLSFFDKADRASFIKLAKSMGVDVLGSISLGNSVRIRVGSREQYEKLMKKGPVPIEQSSNYRVKLPRETGEAPMQPGSGYFSFGGAQLKWLGVSGDNSSWGKGVTVAVLDTGVVDHPAIEGVSIERISMIEASSEEPSHHGAAIVSLIAGKGEDVQGVSPGVSILSVQVMDGTGQGDTFSLAQGIVEAVDRGAKVINLSLGTNADSYILKEAVDYAAANNVALVSSVGNEGVEGVLYPARYEGVIAVAGVDAKGNHVYFSNRGPEVDLAAPAVGIFAAGAEEEVEAVSGTSSAAALVSGTFAWVFAENPGISLKDATAAVLDQTNDSDAPGVDDRSGNGILNIERIESSDKKGVYDIAVCSPYLQTADSGDSVTLFVENRGTEELGKVSMQVSIDGSAAEFDLYNIPVGGIESREFILDGTKMESSDGIKLEFGASIVGSDDVRPGNNYLRGAFKASD